MATKPDQMKLKLWPVAAGILVDTFGSLVVGLLFLSVVLGAKVSSAEASEDLLTSTQMAIADGLGLFLSAVGGFVSGRLARIDEVHHGAATGFGSLIVGILLAVSIPAEGPHTWHDLLMPLAVVPSAALGGYVAARMNARTAGQPM